MPEIKHFIVTQTREVHVSAISIVDAVQLANAAFENGQNHANGVINGPEGIWGNTDTQVREIDLSVQLDR